MINVEIYTGKELECQTMSFVFKLYYIVKSAFVDKVVFVFVIVSSMRLKSKVRDRDSLRQTVSSQK